MTPWLLLCTSPPYEVSGSVGEGQVSLPNGQDSKMLFISTSVVWHGNDRVHLSWSSASVIYSSVSPLHSFTLVGSI